MTLFNEKMDGFENRINQLAEMIACHNRIVFFGGAGVSTESDIPDFRGTNGIYNQSNNSPYTMEEMLSHHFYEEHPVEFFTNYKIREGMMKTVKPNRAHIALKKLEQEKKLSAIVTQNIDGLHQAAGSETVYELHGCIHRNFCTQCYVPYNIDEFIHLCTPIPYCPKCGGIIKPDVVLYEESLDNDTVINSIEAIRNAVMLIIGGTSLVVYPAAGLIREFTGDALVLINRDPTPKDHMANLVFRESIGLVLDSALNQL